MGDLMSLLYIIANYLQTIYLIASYMSYSVAINASIESEISAIGVLPVTPLASLSTSI